MSNLVHELLARAGWNFPTGIAEAQVSLPLAVLDTLSEQYFEHERIIEEKLEEKAVLSQLVETAQKQQSDQAFFDLAEINLKEAYAERGAAQRQALTAMAALTHGEQNLAKSEEKSKARIQELEAHITRLQSGDATPVVEMEKQLKEAQEKATVLEKRLQTARQNEDYARTQYQEVSAASNAAIAERAETQEQIEALQKEADKTRVEIQKINKETQTRALSSRIAELETAVETNKWELDRLRRENIDLRTNRRETRQGSTPRSPRPGLMSPRGRGAALSREVSPVMGGVITPGGNGGIAGMQYTTLNGGQRWGRGQVP